MLLGGAVVFDVYHDNHSKTARQSQENTTDANIGIAQVFYFNSGSNFKLTTRVDKLLSCILHAANQDKFLSRFHNYRTFHTLKEKSLNDRKPFHLMAHFMKFSRIQYAGTDDDTYHSASFN